MGKLYASEKKVGLPIGQFGNSEVGHMNIGRRENNSSRYFENR